MSKTHNSHNSYEPSVRSELQHKIYGSHNNPSVKYETKPIIYIKKYDKIAKLENDHKTLMRQIDDMKEILKNMENNINQMKSEIVQPPSNSQSKSQSKSQSNSDTLLNIESSLHITNIFDKNVEYCNKPTDVSWIKKWLNAKYSSYRTKNLCEKFLDSCIMIQNDFFDPPSRTLIELKGYRIIMKSDDLMYSVVIYKRIHGGFKLLSEAIKCHRKIRLNCGYIHGNRIIDREAIKSLSNDIDSAIVPDMLTKLLIYICTSGDYPCPGSGTDNEPDSDDDDNDKNSNSDVSDTDVDKDRDEDDDDDDEQ